MVRSIIMSLIQNITSLLCDGLQRTPTSPDIKVSFYRYNSDFNEQKALQRHWDSLVKQLDANPENILKREWKTHEYSWEKQEIITVESNGLIVVFEGVHYPMSGSKPEQRTPQYSQTEYANNQVGLQLGHFINAVSQASDDKKLMVFHVVSAATNQSLANDELVTKVTASVIQSLILKKVFP